MKDDFRFKDALQSHADAFKKLAESDSRPPCNHVWITPPDSFTRCRLCALPYPGPQAPYAPARTLPMTKAEYIAFHAACCQKMATITAAKNADYTGITDDPFANFSDTETYAGVPTERGFLVRMGDKMARIRSFADRGELSVKDESVEDTLLDLANYCILMAGYLKGRK